MWDLKDTNHVQKMNIIKMRVFKWMSSNVEKNKKISAQILDMLEKASTPDKMIESFWVDLDM